MALFKQQFPWTSTPLIVNAPMATFAGPSLATAVSLAGGFGFIGGAHNMATIREQLQTASETFKASTNPAITSSPTLPLGVGFLAFICKIEEVAAVVQEYKPSVVWLFAAKQLTDYADWASAIRSASPQSKLWIQVGNVSAALTVAEHAKPDALCLQGADAGGHGFEHGAGIVSLVPEAADALRRAGFGSMPLLASGGIVDGRGVAAALALGAKAAVLGTRFLASKEIYVHPIAQAAVLEAEDGGKATKRSKLFDMLRGPTIWPEGYDGRSLVMQSYEDYVSGVGLEEVQKRHGEAVKGEDKGYALGRKGREAIWAGTGVGLVKEVEGAGQIVEKVRRQANEIVNGLRQE